MMKEKINPKTVVEEINSILNDFRNDPIDPNLTKEEIASIKIELDKVILLALKIKLKPEMKRCYKTTPAISSRDFLIHLLKTLPKDTPRKLLPLITEHIIEEWIKLSKKMTA